MAFGIVAFTSVDLDVGDIARSAERHKNHHLVDACQGIAFGGHIGYLHPLKQRQVFFLASHYKLKFLQSYS